jgi:hypothetical protein
MKIGDSNYTPIFRFYILRRYKNDKYILSQNFYIIIAYFSNKFETIIILMYIK